MYLNLWKKVEESTDMTQDFRVLKRFGYSMREFKVSEQLFFWHAFTRKKIQHNLWLYQGKKYFKMLAFFRKQRNVNVNVLQPLDKKNKNAFYLFKKLNNLFSFNKKHNSLNFFIFYSKLREKMIISNYFKKFEIISYYFENYFCSHFLYLFIKKKKIEYIFQFSF